MSQQLFLLCEKLFIFEILYSKKENLNDPEEIKKLIKTYGKEMNEAAEDLDFEKASILRDQIASFKKQLAILKKKKD